MRYLGKIRGKPGLLSCSTIMRTSHWNATLLPITLSPGLGCLVCTYRIQIWSKLRNRLSLWGPLQRLYITWRLYNITIRPFHILLALASCCLLASASWAVIAWASCCLFCRATFSPVILLPPFHNHFWSVWVTFPKNIYLNTITNNILLSVAIVPFLSLWDSLSPLLWNLSLGVFLRFLHFPNYKGMPYLHFNCSLDEHAVSESAYARINPYMYLHRSLDEHAVTASAYARIICMYELLTVIKMEDPTDV